MGKQITNIGSHRKLVEMAVISESQISPKTRTIRTVVKIRLRVVSSPKIVRPVPR